MITRQILSLSKVRSLERSTKIKKKKIYEFKQLMFCLSNYFSVVRNLPLKLGLVYPPLNKKEYRECSKVLAIKSD